MVHHRCKYVRHLHHSLPQFPIKGKLGMGVVTLNTPGIILGFFDPDCPMKSLFQPFLDIIMAGEALIGPEKVRELLADILRVGVKITSGNVIVAVQAGGLPMDGDMVSCLIDHP